MFTLVQDGLTPLAMGHMWSLEATVTAFLAETPEAVRFDHLVEALQALHDADTDWSDLPRQPTQLEIMAACCAVERRGDLRFDFIGGLLHVSSPCA